MRIIKKVIKVLLFLTIGLCIGLFAVLMLQMYKPVLDASKTIDEVDDFAMKAADELVNRDAKIIGLGEATQEMKN